METLAAITGHRPAQRPDYRSRRVSIIWVLLVLNVLSPGQATLLPIPHRFLQLVTQGALFVALVLAVSINPRLRMRPSWFLGLYSVLAISSLMMSVRLVGLGTEFRSVRFIVFLLVLWLLTPWWGRRDLLILRSQVRALMLILGSVVLGLCISPGKSMTGGRLNGTFWPVAATGVAHFGVELAGLTALLWLCRLISRRRAVVVIVPAMVIVVLSHTRTALTAMLLGLLVAGGSLLLTRRRVRRTFAAVFLVVVVIGIPTAPLLAHWATRGENTQQLHDLTGRTKAWSAVLGANRPAPNVIFGSGLSNDTVNGSTNPLLNGRPIDNSWLSIYQDQGIFGDVLLAGILLLLLVMAITRARGPTRALALFLIVYCLVAGINETGLGSASPYLLDLTVVASLVTLPAAMGTELTFGPTQPDDLTLSEIEQQ